jgi:hypothetical protein
MEPLLPFIFVTSLVFLAGSVLLTIHIMTILDIDLMSLWIPTTMGLAVGCILIFNVERANNKDKENEGMINK